MGLRSSINLCLIGLFAVSASSTACSSSKGNDSKSDKGSSKARLANPGVHPEYFECESLLSAKEVEKIVAGSVEQVAPSFSAPSGVAEPCAFLHTIAPEGDAGVRHEALSFDLDCRDDALKDAETMMSQWADGAGDLGTEKVDVGNGGLDHGGGGLVFIDDDSPCHVRVIGPRPDMRLAIAKVLAKRLTPDNAPMKDIRTRKPAE